jgi:hypothetical protein
MKCGPIYQTCGNKFSGDLGQFEQIKKQVVCRARQHKGVADYTLKPRSFESHMANIYVVGIALAKRMAGTKGYLKQKEPLSHSEHLVWLCSGLSKPKIILKDGG